MQVLLAAMLVDAFHAALEDREIAFDRVGADVAANMFFLAVIDSLMAGEFGTDCFVPRCLIRHQIALATNIDTNDRDQLAQRPPFDMEAACAALAFHQRENGTAELAAMTSSLGIGSFQMAL